MKIQSQASRTDCGKRPKRPRIPSRPTGLSCSSTAVAARLKNCTVSGVAELACSEVLEGKDTRITTGAAYAAACSAASATVQGKAPNKGDMIGAGIIGAVDNAGEKMGGFWGAMVRLASAGVKASVISECRRDVRVQCDPEIALGPYRRKLAKYKACLANQ